MTQESSLLSKLSTNESNPDTSSKAEFKSFGRRLFKWKMSHFHSSLTNHLLSSRRTLSVAPNLCLTLYEMILLDFSF
ncbi:hypothetical protein Hanom_Chr08g00704491 [Helianthus anomalus]